MDFVDHVDLKASVRRNVFGALQKRDHVINTAGGCRVHFDVVNEAVFVNGSTGFANAAGLSGNAALSVRPDTVQTFGKNSGNRRFTDTARTRKKVSMVKSIFRQGMRQGTNNVILSEQRRKIMRPPLACQNLV